MIQQLQQIIRAIPNWAGQPETFYDITKLTWEQKTAFREELGQQGFYVQDIHLQDPLPVQVAIQIRKEQEEQQQA